MVAIPRYRDFHRPAVFAHGFRPFFLAAGIWSALALLLWAAMLWRGTALPTAFTPAVWHAHAMIFGFLGAGLAGFLTTAVPNWTGRMPLQGLPLAGLAGLWLVGRMACGVSGTIGAPAAMLLDLSFFVVLWAAIAREIIAGRNWRNLPVLAAVGMITIADLLVHLDPVAGLDPGYGLRLAIGTFSVLIALIGGRIVPSFTRNWLVRRGEKRLPAAFGNGDRAIVILTAVTMIAWTVASDHVATGSLAVAAAGAHLWRISRWQGHLTWREPLLLMLHLGYGWLVVGLALLGLGNLLGSVPATAAVHALTAGAMGSMMLAVMMRATLGHTGRALTADAATTAIFALVSLSALLRSAAPFLTALTPELLMLSAAGWIAGFLGFVLRYGPILTRPRLAG